MFSLIITVVAIALVVALALATLYYGGTAFNQSSAKATAAKVIAQAQQMLGAADLYRTDTGLWPASMDDLTNNDYLKSVPVAQNELVGTALAQTHAWAMALPSHPVFTVSPIAADACKAINQMAVGLDGIPQHAVSTWNVHCFGSDMDALTVIASKDSAETTLAIDPVIGPPPDCSTNWAVPPTSCDPVVPPSSPGALTIAPQEGLFADTKLGTTASVLSPLVVTNGTSGAVSLTGFTSTNPTVFPVGMGTCGATLDAAATCVLDAQFSPTAVGQATVLATLTSPAGNLTALLQGKGVADPGHVCCTGDVGGLTLSYTSVTFPDAAVGGYSVPATALVMTNTSPPGGPDVTWDSDPSVGTANFYAYAGSCLSPLAPGASCVPSLEFDPLITGHLTDTMTWVTSAGTVTIAMDGTGIFDGSVDPQTSVGPLSASYGSLTYPDTLVGGYAGAPQLLITNISNVSVPLMDVTFTGDMTTDNSVLYVDSGSCIGALAPGAVCSPWLEFDPVDVGLQTGFASLPFSWAPSDSSPPPDLNTGVLIIPMQGTGMAAAALPMQVTYNATRVGKVDYQGPSGLTAGYNQGTLNLGTVSVNGGGNSPEYTFVVTNQSASPLWYGGPSNGVTSGGMVTSATQTGDCVSSQPLAAGASCNFNFHVRPSVNGGSSSVSVTYGPSAGAQTVWVQVSLSANANATLDMSWRDGDTDAVITAWDFGTASARQPGQPKYLYLLSNSLQPVTVTATIVPAGWVLPDGDYCAGNTLVYGDSCWVYMSFEPTEPRAYSGTLSVSVVGGTAPTLPVTGTGQESEALNVSWVDGDTGSVITASNFGNVGVGQQSYGVRNIGFRNNGSQTITLTNTIPPAGWVMPYGDQCVGVELPGGDQCSAYVAFAPTELSAYSGVLGMGIFGGPAPTLPVTGTGVTPQDFVWLDIVNGMTDITATGYTYPGTQAGQTVIARLFVQNTSGQDQTFGSNAVSVPSGFVVTNNSCYNVTIASGGGCEVDVSFYPSAVQSYSGFATVQTTTSGVSTSLAVSGTGTVPTGPNFAWLYIAGDMADVTATGYSYPSTQTGQVVYGSFLVRNDSGQSQTFASGALSLPSGFVDAYDVCSGVTVSNGNGCVVEIDFSPTAVQSYGGAATLQTITSGVSTSLAVSGTGTVRQNFAWFDVSNGYTDITATGYSYAATPVGQTADVQLWVSNVSGQSQTFDSAPLSLPSGFVATYDQCSGVTVSDGDGCSVQIWFSPSAVQPYGGSATLQTTTSGVSASLAVGGTGTSGSSQPAAFAWLDVANAYTDITATGYGYAATPVGQAPYRSFWVLNISGQSQTFGSYALSLPSGFVGVYDGCSDVTVSAGGNCEVTISFSPSAVQPYSGLATLQTTTSGVSTSLAVSGAGQEPEALDVSWVDADAWSVITAWDFGSAGVGPKNPLYLKNLYLRNNSLTHTITLTQTVLPAGWVLWSGDNCLNRLLPPGNSCSVQLVFLPTELRSYSGALGMSVVGGTAPTLLVTGTGTTPPSFAWLDMLNGGADVTATGYSYASTSVGQTTEGQFLVSNISAQAQTFDSSPLSVPSGFVIVYDGCSGVTANPMGACEVDISFSPSAVQSYSGPATVQATSGVSTSLAVSGAGTVHTGPDFAWHDALDDNAEITEYLYPDTQTFDMAVSAFWVVNISGQSQTFDSDALSLPSGFILGYEGCSGVTLTNGDGCPVDVSFAPSAAQSYSGPITLQTTTSGVSTSLAVSGTATAHTGPNFAWLDQNRGNADVTVTGYSYPDTESGQATAGSFWVQNMSGVPQTFGSDAVSLSPGFVPNYDSCSGATVGSGDSCEVYIDFSPSAVQSYSGSITLQTTTSGVSTTLAVSGRGIAHTGPDFVWRDMNIGGWPDITTPGYSYPGTQVGQSGYREFWVTNNSGQAQTFASNALSLPSGFEVVYEWCSGVTVSYLNGCEMDIAFTPAAVQSYSGYLTLQTTTSGVSTSLAVSGNGTSSGSPPVALDISYNGARVGKVMVSDGSGWIQDFDMGTLDLGSFTPDGQGWSGEYTFVVTNTSTQGLGYGGPGQGAGGGGLMVSFPSYAGDCSYTNAPLAPGATCTIRFHVQQGVNANQWGLDFSYSPTAGVDYALGHVSITGTGM